jgi:hypothetical protein
MIETYDFSRVDAFAAARRRAMQAREMWKPALAGAAGAALVIGCVYVTLPKFTIRDVVVDHVVRKDAPFDVPAPVMKPVVVPEITTKPVVVPDIITHPVDIPIPNPVNPRSPATVAHETPPALAPRTPAERRFEAGNDWNGAIIRGRILRVAPPNGMILATETGEAPFYPARDGPNGPEPDPTKRDDISGLQGRLALCRETPSTVYICVSLAPNGAEELIPERPMGEPL